MNAQAPNAVPANSQAGDSKQRNSSTIETFAKAFIGKITESGEGENLKYYVNVSLPAGEDKHGKSQYQYMDLYVGKSLRGLFQRVYQSQFTAEDKKQYHCLSGQLARIKIFGSFFEVWQKDDKAGINTSGVLSGMSYGNLD